MKPDIKKLKSIINNFKNINVFIIGDIIYDEYIWGDVSRISPEAPVPIVDVNKITFSSGGAANVGRNISALSKKVYLSGVIGNDEYGLKLKEYLKNNNINTDYIITDESRPTTRKTRIIAHNQQVVRIDNEIKKQITIKNEEIILNSINEVINDIDVFIISDYAKGVITKNITKKITALIKYKNKILIVDPKVENFNYYKNSTIMTPNKNEAGKGIGINIKDEQSLYYAGNTILKKLNLDALLITRSEEGMSLFWKDKIYNIPAEALEVYDVTGAGDTVAAILALSLGAGANYLEAALLSNCAAGIVVKEIGCAVASKTELQKKINKISGYVASKIKSIRFSRIIKRKF